MEKWIKGFEGIYSVTTDGEILSYRRSSDPVPLSPCKHENGFMQVGIWDGRRKINVFVHRIVAEAFVPHDEYHTIVRHKDGDKCNNSASNLTWIKSRKPVAQYDLNGNLLAVFTSLMSAKEITGVSTTQIRCCCTGKTSTAHGYVWKFIDLS